MPDLKRQKAARAIAAGASQAAAARESGTHRATIKRWLDDPEFSELVAQYREEPKDPEAPEATAAKGLADLVTDALVLLKEAMTGSEVSAARARVALEIVVKAAAMSGTEGGGEAAATWASMIEELDARGSARPD